MIQECKTYLCDSVPTDDDINEALEIANKNGCVIKLMYSVKYSGTYSLFVTPGHSTLESVKNQMPKIYAKWNRQ